MSEYTELLELAQNRPEALLEIFQKDEKLRNNILENFAPVAASREVSAGGFASYYAEQYGRKLPSIMHDVAEEFSWAYHNRKGVILEGWRGLGKSTFFLAWCPYVMGVNPLGSTALVRINDGKAKEMGKTISNIIMTNSGWKKVFPHVLPDEKAGWSAENGFEVMDTRITGQPGSPEFDKGYAEWRMKCLANHLSEKSLVCNGVESGGNIGLHPTNGMWFDDLHDDDNTRSVTELGNMKKLIEGNFVGTWFSAGGSPALGVFCTPWSKNPPDAYQVMLGTGLFKHIKKPIMTVDPNGEPIPMTTSEGQPIDPAWAGKKVKPTWNDAFPVQKIADIIHAAKTRFGQQYMLDLEMSKPKQMKYMSFPHSEIRWNEWDMTLGVDPVTWVRGVSSGDGVSHFAAYQLLKTPYNTLVVAGGKLERCDALEGQDYVADVQRTFLKTFRAASIENNGGGAIFIAMLSRSKGIKYHQHPVSELGSGDKKKRQFDFLQPLFANGSVQVSDEDTPELRAVREYLETFPNFEKGSYLEDVGDALCMGILDIPEIWTRVINTAAPSGTIWAMKKKPVDPWQGVLEGRR